MLHSNTMCLALGIFSISQMRIQKLSYLWHQGQSWDFSTESSSVFCIHHHLYSITFLKQIIYSCERGGAKKERERESQAYCPLSGAWHGVWSQDPEIMTELQLNQLSHPRAPTLLLLYVELKFVMNLFIKLNKVNVSDYYCFNFKMQFLKNSFSRYVLNLI